MDYSEKAKLVALARLLGVDGSADEIVAKFESYEKQALNDLAQKIGKGNITTKIELGDRGKLGF